MPAYTLKKKQTIKESHQTVNAGKQAMSLPAVNAVQTKALAAEEAVQKKENTTGLPDHLKNGAENLSGFSLDDVKVHYNSDKPKQLQAHAYAQGTNIHVAPGQERHLPHEAWHIVQQKQGRVQPTLQMKEGTPINDDKALENEADVMGEKALQRKLILNQLPQPKNDFFNTGSDVFQLTKWKWDKQNGSWDAIGGDNGEKEPEFEGAYDGEIYDDEPKKKRKKDEDSTYKGNRTIGDSSRLAKNRYNLSKKHVDFKTWKKKREAQHLIPASLAKRFKALVNIIDDADNGMMLPSTYAATNTKVTHRKGKQRDHRKYTNNVSKLIDNLVAKKRKKMNQKTMIRIMQALRPVNKLTTYQHLDDIPYNEFQKSWNSQHKPINHI